MSDWEDETGPVAAQAPRHNYGDRIYRSTGGGGGRGYDRSGGDQRSNRGNNSYQQNDGNKKVICVPSHKVGRIIGKGGSKIRDLEFESDAKIKIGDSSSNNTDVTLFGTDDAVLKVESMIYKLIEDRRPREDFNQSTSSTRDRDQRSSRGNNYQPTEGNKKVISVPSHKVGRIIGKGGSKIRDLEYDSEAKIKIGDSNGNNTDVTLIGTDDAVLKVEGMIFKLLEDRRPPQGEDYNQGVSSNGISDLMKTNEQGRQVVDWEKVREKSKDW